MQTQTQMSGTPILRVNISMSATYIINNVIKIQAFFNFIPNVGMVFQGLCDI